MSDQLPRPDYDGLIRMSGDAMWNEGYALGVQDSMLRATQIERVLTDLITELREETERWFPAGAALRVEGMADRAEKRLRELDAPPHSTNEHNNLGGGRR